MPTGVPEYQLVADIEFLGAASLPSGSSFEGFAIGGLSGIAYDARREKYYAISDDRSSDARFFELRIDLADGAFDAGDIKFVDVTTLSTFNGNPFAAGSLDPEGIAIGARGTLYISSEGDQSQGIAPFVARFSKAGRLIDNLPVDAKFLPTADQSSGIRNNLAFESLTVSPNGKRLFTATENALFQDGPAASRFSGSAARIVEYDTATGLPVAEYIYVTEPVATTPQPITGFATNGLVELLALDDQGTLLALERSFSVGVGNTIKLFLVRTSQATNVLGVDAVEASIDPFEGELELNLDQTVRKELLLDLGELGIPLDNIEGMTFGPDQADGRKTLVLVSDDNFSPTQVTQFITLALELDTLPTLDAVRETPGEVRYDLPDTTEGADADDPAIYLDPVRPEDSVIITAMKNAGLRVYDLKGNEVGRVAPDGIRYNNVDVQYGVPLGEGSVDIAVASDRANDTVAIFAIDPVTKALTDITSALNIDSIFGVDDGEATAYGLAGYTSPKDGRHYVFVTQADGRKIAQLELLDDGMGGIRAELVRTLRLPVAEGDRREDYQSEGIAIDRETGIGYVTVEDRLGLLAFDAEPKGSKEFTVLADIDSPFFAPDLEGVAIHYGANGKGALIVSSQGDSTFAVFDRQSYDYLGSFAIGRSGATDGVEGSDGLDIFSGYLGEAFPRGLLVTQDGSNERQVVIVTPDDDEVQNYNSNFKYIDLDDVIEALDLARGDPDYDPRVLPGVELFF